MFFFSVCQGWDELEKAEHEREVALRDELIRSAIIIIVIGKGLSVIASIIHHILHLILVLLKWCGAHTNCILHPGWFIVASRCKYLGNGTVVNMLWMFR